MLSVQITGKCFLFNEDVFFFHDILQFIINMSYCPLFAQGAWGYSVFIQHRINSSESDPSYAFRNRHFYNCEKVSLYFSTDTLHEQPLSTWNFFLSTDLQSRRLSVCLQRRFYRKVLWNGSVNLLFFSDAHNVQPESQFKKDNLALRKTGI